MHRHRITIPVPSRQHRVHAMSRDRVLPIMVVLLMAAHPRVAAGADAPAGPSPLPMAAGAVFTLDQFGPVGSPPEAQAAL